MIWFVVSIMILCVMMENGIQGEIQSYTLESGPYGNNWDKTWKIQHYGAEKIKVHFAWIKTEKRYDWVKTSAGDSWTGTYSNVWSKWQHGDTILIRLTSDRSITDSGFRVDKIEVKMQNNSSTAPSRNSPPTNSTSVPQQIITQYRGIRSNPYGNNWDKTWEIHQYGAKKIKVHFAWIKTEKRYDWVRTSASYWDRWTGHHYDVWSRWEYGDTIVITLTSDRSKTDEGFFIDYIQYEI